MKQVYFIVVNYNNSAFTRELCISLEAQICVNIDIQIRCIVINNSSNTTDTINLKEYCNNRDWITVIDCPDNPGYFGGLNNGLKYITKLSKTYVVISNNDILFGREFVSRLTNTKYPLNVFAVCPNIITNNGVRQNPQEIKQISVFRRILYKIYYRNYYAYCILQLIRRVLNIKKIVYSNYTGEIHMGIGACYVLTTEYFKHYEMLNYPAFMYGEEAFISSQIHSKGGILWYDPMLHVVHAESAALSIIPRRVAYEYARSSYNLYISKYNRYT